MSENSISQKDKKIIIHNFIGYVLNYFYRNMRSFPPICRHDFNKAHWDLQWECQGRKIYDYVCTKCGVQDEKDVVTIDGCDDYFAYLLRFLENSYFSEEKKS